MEDLDPSMARKLDLVDVLVEQANYEGALKVCNEAIDGNANSFEFYSERARIYHHLGRWSEALRDLHVLIELRPESPTAYLRRATLNLELGNYHLAVYDLTFVIESKDEYFLTAALFYRAVAHLKSGNKKEAILDCQELPSDFSFYIRTKDTLGQKLSRDEIHNMASSSP